MISTLKQIPLFHGLSDDELSHVEASAAARTFAKGAIIITEGEAGSSMFLLMQGRVKVYVSDSNGKEYVLAVLGPGEYVGELALLDDEPRTASVETEEQSTFLVIQKEDFLTLMRNHPQIQFKVLVNLVRRTRQLTEAVKNLALRDVYTRVRILFEDLAVEREGQYMVEEPMTQQAIADRVGSSREMVARIMKELVFGGYVRVENRRLIILQKLPEAF
ncbi:Crp/Fnr family transcriptional regulator [Chitinimonas taiwanensis]|uniref:CRP/FNR family transcriptional regulator, cyclic AMP receptor protein n=1 Tax=Chitinimonas taiwanensis DSM 18899 TaxID=1121279 RepID=A0A1K2HP64_9NEIS|nr:Crp/Fnr family transcriptional regulator [Chitinimonas taiwanensis]SFZ78050.1 CRP/FNR family transcriptional regulator, cyclic AMP receptor protein [Chitinimonas taiwanensis DSM 18899]